ncbi:hypothetical protein RYH73_16205 [Olivibacter sp. CPCC 100613]|uniref:hypothetical protein n=1 Tax=Olivibacter sp. CPCC 100613 TaxID=3079931 RepID=UPI002FFC8C78
MKLANITKEGLREAQNKGHTVLVTQYDSDPLEPIWIFEKVEEAQIPAYAEELHKTYQLCYAISEAVETIDAYPFIGKVYLSGKDL